MFGLKTKSAVLEVIGSLLRENLVTINEVHEKAGDVTLAIKVKLGAIGKNGTECLVSLEYIKEKVKSDARFQVDERQLELFQEAEASVDADPGEPFKTFNWDKAIQ